MKVPSKAAALILTVTLGAALVAACERKTPETEGTTSSSVEGAGSGATSGTSGATGSTDTAPSSGAGIAIADSVVTGKIKAALIADSDLRSMDIAVETQNGEVVLSGQVMNQAQIDRAVNIAQSMEGVVGVQNRLAIRP